MCFLLLAGVFCLVTPQASALNAKEFFTGDWTLEYQPTSLADPTQPGQAETIQWKIKDANETLVGTYIDEKDEERAISVEFISESSGNFQLANEEEEFAVIFSFDFVNRTTGQFSTQGSWKDDVRGEVGVYHLIATSPASFVMTVVTTDEKGYFSEISAFTARKIVEKEPPGILSRFGLPLLMFGVILFSQFMKGRATAQQQQPQQPSAAGTNAGNNNTNQQEGQEDDEGEDEADGSTDSAAGGDKKND